MITGQRFCTLPCPVPCSTLPCPALPCSAEKKTNPALPCPVEQGRAGQGRVPCKVNIIKGDFY